MAEGVWRTIGGRRVFIKNGQSLSEAMKESGKFGKKNKKPDSMIHTSGEEVNLDSEEAKRSLQETKRKADEWREQHGEKPIFTDKEKGLTKEEKLLEKTKSVSDMTNEEHNIALKEKKDKRQAIIEKLDKETADLDSYDKYNLAVSKLENTKDMQPTERQYWVSIKKEELQKHLEKLKELRAGYNGRSRFTPDEEKWKKELDDAIDKVEKKLNKEQIVGENEKLTKSLEKPDFLKDEEASKSTNDFMNKKIRSKGKAKFEEDLPKKVEIKTQGTSNRKEVSENIQAHILDFYTEDFTGEDIPATEAFVRQMDAMDWLPNKWKAGEEIAKGGSYLIYNQDMADFLDELKINPKGKTFSEDKAFDMYTSLVGRESAKLYDRIQKNAYNKYLHEHPLSKISFNEFLDMKKK